MAPPTIGRLADWIEAPLEKPLTDFPLFWILLRNPKGGVVTLPLRTASGELIHRQMAPGADPGDQRIERGLGKVSENENRSKIAISAESKEEADHLFNGLSAGGEVEVPMSDSFGGSYFGMFLIIAWSFRKDVRKFHLYKASKLDGGVNPAITAGLIVPAPAAAPGSVQQKIADFYNSFLNQQQIDAAGLAPLQEELAAFRCRSLRNGFLEAHLHFGVVGDLLAEAAGHGRDLAVEERARHVAQMVEDLEIPPGRVHDLEDRGIVEQGQRQRALALLELAHADHRERLVREARRRFWSLALRWLRRESIEINE